MHFEDEMIREMENACIFKEMCGVFQMFIDEAIMKRWENEVCSVKGYAAFYLIKRNKKMLCFLPCPILSIFSSLCLYIRISVYFHAHTQSLIFLYMSTTTSIHY